MLIVRSESATRNRASPHDQFPGLDGGRLFFVLFGAVLRRRLSPQVEAAIHAVGFVLLVGLLVIDSISDIRRAIGGWSGARVPADVIDMRISAQIPTE